MQSRDAVLVGGGAAPGHDAPPASRREARPRQLTSPLRLPAVERWTSRKTVLVAVSGASVLWSVLFGALTLFRG